MEVDDGQVERSSQTQKRRKGKEKEKKRAGRGRRPHEEMERPPQLDADGNPIPKAPRYPKRQCALMLGFCGSGYSGMQMCATHSELFIQRTHISISQPDVRTIEGVLFDALVKIGAVSQDNADNPTKVFHSILQKILR